MSRRSSTGIGDGGDEPRQDRSASGEGPGGQAGRVAGERGEDGALGRIVAVEARLAELVSDARARARAIVADARAQAEARGSLGRERIAEAEAALEREIADERERRLAGVREEARRELERFADPDEETVDALAAWAVDRVVSPQPLVPPGPGGVS